MFTKSTLKFAIPAALLFAGVNANAQNNVMLEDGTQTTWAEVVNYFKNKPSADDLKAAVDTAQAVVNRTPKTIKVTDPAYVAALDSAKAFNATYQLWANTGGAVSPDTPKVYFSAAANKITKKNTLNVAFVKINGFTEATAEEFYDKALDTDAEGVLKIDVVNVFLSATQSIPVTTYTSDDQLTVPEVVYNFLNDDTNKANYQTEDTNPAYTEAEKALADAKAAQAAEANNYYQHIELLADVNVAAGNTLMNYEGTIDAANHVFTVPSGYLFGGTFKVTLENAAVNGNVARDLTNVTFDNVAVWDGKAGVVYTTNENKTDYKTLGELAYADRNTYGVTDGKLAALTDANKVYSITVYNTEKGAAYFVTAADGAYTDLATNKAVTVAKNVFVKSADTDLEGVNVFYADGTAKQVEITDGVDFFCPEDITAESISYDRNFKEGHNSAYLPFAINSVNLDAQISTYNADATVENAFQFNYQDEAAAYTPMLLTVKEAGKLEGLSGVVKASSEAPALTGNGATGLLKKTVFNQVAGAGKTVWGLSNNKFLYGANGVQFPAFRMLIVTDAAAAASEAPRKIVILDEYGQESGVDNVATDAAALEVVGGVGELTISTSADLGDVAVYSIDGRVAANVNAAAGITTVNLAKGVYIVMGKKVLVK